MGKVLILLAVLLITACSDKEDTISHITLHERSFKMATPEENNLALKQMDQQGINYRLDQKGFIIVQLTDIAEVYGIQRSIHFRNRQEDLKDTFKAPYVEQDELYEAAFNRANTPVIPFKSGNRTLFMYDQADGPKVDLVRQGVEIMLLEREIESFKKAK